MHTISYKYFENSAFKDPISRQAALEGGDIICQLSVQAALLFPTKEVQLSQLFDHKINRKKTLLLSLIFPARRNIFVMKSFQ
jgi:hypothetical protein